MGNVIDFHEVGKMDSWEHKCDIHSLTRTRTLKGGWFGLTRGYNHETWSLCVFSHAQGVGGANL